MCALHIPGAYFAIDCLLNVECTCILEQVWKITNILFPSLFFNPPTIQINKCTPENEETEIFVLITITLLLPDSDFQKKPEK